MDVKLDDWPILLNTCSAVALLLCLSLSEECV